MVTRTLTPREVVRDLPNFRDFGRTVARPLLTLLCNLVKKYGEAFVSEASLRVMIWEDTGHMPGVGTVAKALKRFARQGLITHTWLYAGGIKPDGEACHSGLRLIGVPQVAKRRAAARENAKRNAREGVSRKFVPMMVAAALVGTLARGKAPQPAPRDESYERARAAQLAAAAELQAKWDAEDKPPD